VDDASWLAAHRDKVEIEELLIRYCSCIDTKDFPRLSSVFTPDASIDYTKSGGIAGPLPDVQAWLTKALAPFTVVQHMVTNIAIELDGDRATSVCSFYNPMGTPSEEAIGGTGLFFCGGFYRDELVRTDAGWRISKRINDQIYTSVIPRPVR
jgi:hypothetical protein